MISFRLLAALLGLALLPRALGASPSPYDPNRPSLNVASFTADWRDTNRNRVVPVRIYHPVVAGDTPSPVIIFSHGLGGSRDGYSYLGEYWAAHGYVCVHLQHLGSDEAIWKNTARPARGMAKAAADPDNIVNRPRDVRFALDELTRLNRDESFPLHGRLDLTRIGMAGHSFGAYTTMAMAGETPPGNPGISAADPRIKAAIAMSTPVKETSAQNNGAFSAVAIPVYHLTGTKDVEPFGTSDARLRRIPYDEARRSDAYLLVLNGGDHMVFSGQRRFGDGTHDDDFHRLIEQSTTAFWDAWLRQDGAAKAWLENGGFTWTVGRLGTIEQKHPPPPVDGSRP